MTHEKIVVLGGGLVGGPMALDLAAEDRFAVTVVDCNDQALAELRARQPRLVTIREDLSSSSRVTALVAGYDIVLSAVPGSMGHATLAAIIEARRDVVDISFAAEDPLHLQDAAVSAGVTAIVDCGVSPGLSNLLIGRVAAELDRIDNVTIFVGGLPEVRQGPWEYKTVYSPRDLIAVYTRPARFVENGASVTRPALSDRELVDFPGVGTLEAFNTDGLRTLAETISCPNMKEKTLRYPGHVEKILVLRESGFFDEQEITVGDSAVRPVDVTAALLFPRWKMGPGEADVTALRVHIEGRRRGREVNHTFRLLDRFDPQTGTLSMARTTGYTATAAVRMLIEGLYTEPGIAPPELVGRHIEPFEFMIRCLRERGVCCAEEASGGSPVIG